MTQTSLVLQKFLAFTLNRCGQSIARMPREKVLQLGERLGRLGFRLAKRSRVTSLRNLHLIYGDSLTQEQRFALTRKVFEHFGRVALDFYRSALRSDDDVLGLVTEVEGWEHVTQAIATGKGMIGVSGHLGNFEIFVRYLSKQGLPPTVVIRDPSAPVLGGIVEKVSKKSGYTVVARGGLAVRKLLAALKRGEVIGILPDQNGGDVFVPFLGIPAGTATGTAALALRVGAPIVPWFCVFKPDHTYMMIFKEPIWPKADDTEESLMTRVNLALEEGVRQWPEQYLWLHNRWKSAFEEKNASRWPTGYDLLALKTKWHRGA